MSSKNIYSSFNYAIQGVIYVLRTQRNMKVHFLIGIMVIILATVLSVPRTELMVLFLTIGGVITAELVNTAVEEVVNLVTQEYHPLAKIAKNVSAGAVLVSALTSVCIGYLVFIEYFLKFDATVFRQAFPVHYLIVMAVATVTFTIISLKAASGSDDLLRGGMPSGHTALAFALAVAIWQTSSGLPVVAGFALAALVGQSRVEGQIHNWWEVAAGACIGIFITSIFFQLKG